jgi:hypothetical protein
MIHMLVEAQPCQPYALVTDERRTATLEIDTLTAVILSVWQHSDGRRGARLNAFVDGLGHRMVHVELDPDDHHHAIASLRSPGTLVRCAGILIDDDTHTFLHTTQRVQFLVPDDRA